jgi:predicted glycoside hydrolase/deacetylase ChbG (UPF0249 family)
LAVALTIVADDFGMCAGYDRGMLEAARAGAIDGASVMVRRSGGRLEALLAAGIDVGLHLEAEEEGRGLTTAELTSQLAAFERLAGRAPDHLDGHHHCHAGAAIAGRVAELAAHRGIPVRAVGAEHRQLLRSAGARTFDLLVGRYGEDEPVVPAELIGCPPVVGSIEWMVHPGHPDPASGSSYDAGRGEDLDALLSFRPEPGFARVRRSSFWPAPGS